MIYVYIFQYMFDVSNIFVKREPMLLGIAFAKLGAVFTLAGFFFKKSDVGHE